MASKMEVDAPKEEAAGGITMKSVPTPTSLIAVHPLAIVHMTDQHTRVTSGGSRYDVNSPVVGLLLGRRPEEKLGAATTTPTTTAAVSTAANAATTIVLDADDIPLDMSEATRIQVSLHQAVFPLHTVVGWYRVISEDAVDGNNHRDEDYQPTEEDVRLTRDLQHFFQTQPNDAAANAASSQPYDFLFALLHVPGAVSSSTKPTAAKAATSDHDDDDDEEQLALNLFRLYQNTSLIGMEYNQDWKLETSEPERVAIERVIREKAPPSKSTPQRNDDNEADGGGGGGEGGDSTGDIVAVDSGYVSQAQSLQHSLEAMQQRIRIILDYLASISPTASTGDSAMSIPPRPALLRQIHSLQLQLRLLSSAAAASGGNDQDPSILDASFLAQLSTIAKAVCSIQSYTEKLQAIQEHRMSASGGGSGSGGAMGSREDRRRRH